MPALDGTGPWYHAGPSPAAFAGPWAQPSTCGRVFAVASIVFCPSRETSDDEPRDRPIKYRSPLKWKCPSFSSPSSSIRGKLAFTLRAPLGLFRLVPLFLLTSLLVGCASAGVSLLCVPELGGPGGGCGGCGTGCEFEPARLRMLHRRRCGFAVAIVKVHNGR
jgi:hypothetical protein